jgi:hypothetical protein
MQHRHHDGSLGMGHQRPGLFAYMPADQRRDWPLSWSRATVTRVLPEKNADVFKGEEQKWQAVEITESETYDWPATSSTLHPESALFQRHKTL